MLVLNFQRFRYLTFFFSAQNRLDLIVEDQVIVEIKSVKELAPVHEAQLLSYLKLRGGGRGLLINFNVKLLKNGIRRMKILPPLCVLGLDIRHFHSKLLCLRSLKGTPPLFGVRQSSAALFRTYLCFHECINQGSTYLG
ncbi:MAG: hypothetical protein ACI9S8_002486 [Chlamydiales bacterium]|jgi:hypothetical protein